MHQCKSCNDLYNHNDYIHMTYCYSKKHNLCAACCIKQSIDLYQTQNYINSYTLYVSGELRYYIKMYASATLTDDDFYNQIIGRFSLDLINRLVSKTKTITFIARLLEVRYIWKLSLDDTYFYSKFLNYYYHVISKGISDNRIRDIFNWSLVANEGRVPPFIGHLFSDINIADFKIKGPDTISLCCYSKSAGCRIRLIGEDFELYYIVDDTSQPKGFVQELSGDADKIIAAMLYFLKKEE